MKAFAELKHEVRRQVQWHRREVLGTAVCTWCKRYGGRGEANANLCWKGHLPGSLYSPLGEGKTCPTARCSLRKPSYVFSCFSWPCSGFKAMWFLQACWKGKQTRWWPPTVSHSLVPLGITDPLSPPEHKPLNTKPITATFSSLHQDHDEQALIDQVVGSSQTKLKYLKWHRASLVYKPETHKNARYSVAVHVCTGGTCSPAYTPTPVIPTQHLFPQLFAQNTVY